MNKCRLTIWHLSDDGQTANNIETFCSISKEVQVRILDEENLPTGAENVFMFRYSPFFQFEEDGSIIIPNSRPYVWPKNYIWSSNFLALLKKVQDRNVTIVMDYLWEAETTIHDSTVLFLQRAVQFGIDTSRLVLATNNGINLGLRNGFIKTYKIKKLNLPWWLLRTHHELKIKQKIEIVNKNFSETTFKDILCLNRRVRTNKLLALLELDRLALLDSTSFSLVWFHSNTVDYLNNLNCNPEIKRFLERLKVDYTNHTPIQPKNDAVYGEIIRSDEFLFFTRPEWYNETKISCITETFYYDFDPLFPFNDYHDSKVHLTEKTWKAIYFGHPFIMVGERGSLDTIRKLGFQTYGEVVNESYDNLPDTLRMQRAVGQIPQLLDKISSPLVQEISRFNQNLIGDLQEMKKLLNEYLIQPLTSC